jgi:hypothetical protein
MIFFIELPARSPSLEGNANDHDKHAHFTTFAAILSPWLPVMNAFKHSLKNVKHGQPKV